MKIKIIIILFFFTNNVFSQKITGKVFDEENKPVAFSNIYITLLNDTSNIITGTLSDINGNYKLEIKQKGKYILNTSYIGYITKQDTIELKGKNITHNVLLRKSNLILQEVEISTSSLKKENNKTTLYITDNMKAKSSSSFDMLKNISELNVNSLNNKISTKKDGEVKILINGIDATELELLSIKPDNILKVEYYDIIPARYLNSNFKAVINVITKKSLNGINGLIDIKGAITTGFNDDFLNLNYIHNNTKISLNYFFSYRDYKDKRVNEELSFDINNKKYNKKKIGLSSPMGYSLHDMF